jgi:hypothetical protein
MSTGFTQNLNGRQWPRSPDSRESSCVSIASDRCRVTLTACLPILVPDKTQASNTREQESIIEIPCICGFSCIVVPDVPSKGWEHEEIVREITTQTYNLPKTPIAELRIMTRKRHEIRAIRPELTLESGRFLRLGYTESLPPKTEAKV